MSKKRPTRYALRCVVSDGRRALIAADDLARAKLQAKGIGIGDVVFAEIKRPRNPRFNALAHGFGRLVAENIDDFSNMDAHAVLKRLQIESGVGCDEIGFRLQGMWVVQRVPQSLAFESMDEDEFRGVFAGLCRHLIAKYWPSETTESIEQMALMMPAEAA